MWLELYWSHDVCWKFCRVWNGKIRATTALQNNDASMGIELALLCHRDFELCITTNISATLRTRDHLRTIFLINLQCHHNTIVIAPVYKDICPSKSVWRRMASFTIRHSAKCWSDTINLHIKIPNTRDLSHLSLILPLVWIYDAINFQPRHNGCLLLHALS